MGRRTSRRRDLRAVLVISCLTLAVLPARAQSEEDDSVHVSNRVLVYPGALYSSTVGFGVGVGYQIRGFSGEGSSLVAIAKPSQRRGVYELAYASGDARDSRPYTAAALYFEDTGRGRYYGIGPFTSSEARVFAEYSLLRLRGAVGIPHRRTGLVIQPAVELYRAVVDSFRNDDPDAFERFSSRSRDALSLVVGEDLTHVAFGIEASLGMTPGEWPRRSVEVAVHRVQNTSMNAGFWRGAMEARYDFSAGRTLVLLRAAFFSVSGGSEADIPYYMLPMLDGKSLPGYARERFRGRSMLVLNSVIEQPLVTLYEEAGMNLVVGGGLGSVYDQFTRQITPRISFRNHILPDTSAPLRPSGAIGVRAFVGSSDIRALVGVSPEQISLLTLTFSRRITSRRGLFY